MPIFHLTLFMFIVHKFIFGIDLSSACIGTISVWWDQKKRKKHFHLHFFLDFLSEDIRNTVDTAAFVWPLIVTIIFSPLVDAYPPRCLFHRLSV